MKFCYLDESGTGSEPYAVMAGVIVDASRMHLTKSNWAGLLDVLSRLVGKQLLEIHTSDFYAGNGVWHTLPGDIRAKIITIIFEWLSKRKHGIVYSVVDKGKFYSKRGSGSYADEVRSVWRFMALHICLAIQKHFQGLEKNKGNTVLIFDNEEGEASNFIEFIRNPPRWTDTYYKSKRRQVPFDQIIDVPYFGDSRHVGLIQLADFVSFFLRRHIEMQMGISPSYDDEPRLIEEWAGSALALSIPKPALYMQKGRGECADLFYRCAPSCLTS